MAPSTKTVCKNSEKFSYSGKEMSPMGLGYCADAETVGTQMTGKDGKNWIVGVKNNDKIWMRAPEKPLTPEEPVINNEAEPADTTPESEPKTPEKPKKTKKTTDTKSEPQTPDQPIPPTEEPQAPTKPKRKYTKKSKTTDDTQTEKKERKKRGPSGYNLYIGKTMNELRSKTTGLKTTEYMQQAQAMWKALSKEEQTKIGEELKEMHLAAQQEA